MRRLGLLAVLLGALVAPAAAAGAPSATEEIPGAGRAERLVYRWQLEGVSGVLARLLKLLPTAGDGVMTIGSPQAERLEVAFVASSEKAAPDEFWQYETLVDLASWRSLWVRESLRYGKRNKIKTTDLTEVEALDVLSALQLLRRSPPEESERHVIWSNAKLYPVDVTAGPYELRRVDGRDVAVRRYSVRGLREPEQRFWKYQAEVWLTDDQAAIPVEILYKQALGRARLVLVEAAPR